MVEASLFNDNAMIAFSKVSLDSERGVLSLVDINNEKKLTLGLTSTKEGIKMKGQMILAPMAKTLSVTTH